MHKYSHKKRRASPTRDREKKDSKRKRTQYKAPVSDTAEATSDGAELDADTGDSTNEESHSTKSNVTIRIKQKLKEQVRMLRNK